MKFKLKTEEYLQAQIEYFANIGVKEFSTEQKLLLEYSKKLNKIIDLDNLPEDLPREIRKLIEENRDKYVNV